MPRNNYAKLGDSAAKLIDSFMSDRYSQKGFGDYDGKAAKANYYRAQTEGELLDNQQKQNSLNVTADDLIRAMGIDQSDLERVRSGDVWRQGDFPIDEGEVFDQSDMTMLQDAVNGEEVDPQTIDKVRRGDTAFTAHKMGGGKINDIINALGGMQDQNAQDMAYSGDYDTERLSESVAASDGKPIYSQGVNGILQQFSGDLQETDLSRAKVDSQAALTKKRTMTDTIWKKRMHPSEAVVLLKKEMMNDAEIDDTMTSAFGENWRGMISKSSGAPKPETADPLGIR